PRQQILHRKPAQDLRPLAVIQADRTGDCALAAEPQRDRPVAEWDGAGVDDRSRSTVPTCRRPRLSQHGRRLVPTHSRPIQHGRRMERPRLGPEPEGMALLDVDATNAGSPSTADLALA